uniref:SWIRM domain-containing protein n=1 Tax=Acrobeloides nanus TaxID=290746 RepID=A0A914BWE4_9BILA
MDISSSSSNSPEPAERRPVWGNRRRRSNADYGDALSAQFMTSSYQNMDIFRWEDDDIALRCAALHARLPYDCLSTKELEFFPDVAKSRTSMNLYLFLRNKTVQLWQLDPLVELTFEAVYEEIPPPFNSDKALLKRVHEFLQRYGYINFGVFMNLSNLRLNTQRKVIVIGAGAAGLMAARQLKFQGFDLEILEARPRTGGRVMTYRRNMCAADLGAMIIMGITGNPVITLAKQLPVHLSKINSRCPIYDFNGKLVDPRKDEMIQKAFNKLLETCGYIANELNVTEVNGRKISLGEAYDHLLNQQEYRIQKKRLNYWKTMQDLYTKLQQKHKELIICKKAVDSAFQELSKTEDLSLLNAELSSLDSNEDFKLALKLKCLRSDLVEAIKLYETCESERKKLDTALKDQVYMNTTDKRILDFHFANLEYGNGASLYSTSLKEWDQDDIYEFEGCHMMIKEGYGGLLDLVIKDLDISLSHVVEKISYDTSGVKVTCNVQGKQVTFDADAAICTAPLGVLKRSVLGYNDAFKFDPPLPDWKIKAINAMGYGSLNKIALLFDKPFWDQSLNMFGRLNETASARGEMFLFFSNGDSPVLIGLLAGESASIVDKVNEEHLVAKAMLILTTIFPQCPKKPVDCVVTLWHKDRFARGCYSYVGVNACAEDYDRLADPICDENGVPRVLFAGEHTHRHYPATVHGAMLSGIREAARVADTFIGPLPTYSDPPEFTEVLETQHSTHPDHILHASSLAHRRESALAGLSPRKDATMIAKDRAARAARRAAAREEKKDGSGAETKAERKLSVSSSDDVMLLDDETKKPEIDEESKTTIYELIEKTEFHSSTVVVDEKIEEKMEIDETSQEVVKIEEPVAKSPTSESLQEIENYIEPTLNTEKIDFKSTPLEDITLAEAQPKTDEDELEPKPPTSPNPLEPKEAGSSTVSNEKKNWVDVILGDEEKSVEHFDKQVEEEILDSD